MTDQTDQVRPSCCCGVCPELVDGGVDCTCRDNPRCPNCQEIRMTDQTPVTDDDRRKAHEWARMAADNNHDPHNAPWRVAARLFLDHVPAPPKTLAGELREWGDKFGFCTVPNKNSKAFRDLADRVEAVEKENRAALNHAYDERDEALVERDEARAEVERLTAVAEDYARRATAALTERDEARDIARRFVDEADDLVVERDEARTKVEEVEGHLSKSWRQRDAKDVELERLSREREQQEKALVEHGRLLSEARAEVEKVKNQYLTLEVDHATLCHENGLLTEEVERLTASLNRQCTTVTPSVHNTDGLTASNDTLPDPADVPNGEAWVVRYKEEQCNGVKAYVGWAIADSYGLRTNIRNDEVALVSRLVPDTRRVIDRPEDLDKLPVGSVVLEGDREAWRRKEDMWWHGTDGTAFAPTSLHVQESLPVTVIHEPMGDQVDSSGSDS